MHNRKRNMHYYIKKCQFWFHVHFQVTRYIQFNLECCKMKYPKPLTVSMMHYKVKLLYRMIHQAMNIYDFWKFHEHAAVSAKFQSAAMASVSRHLEQQQGATSSRSFWRSEGQPVTDFSTTPAFVLYLSLLFCNCHSKHFTNRSSSNHESERITAELLFYLSVLCLNKTQVYIYLIKNTV